MNRQATKDSGFSLIEMLIGVFIAAVGIIGVLQLQKVFIQASSQSQARTIAMQLVTEQLNAFSRSPSLSTINSATDNKNPIHRSIYSFKRSWTVEPLYYNPTKKQWQNSSLGITPRSVAHKAMKITVNVGWSDIKNNDHNVEQTQILARAHLQHNVSVSANLAASAKPQLPP